MATIEERMKILKMIEEGKITADDGAKLLSALADSRRTPPPISAASLTGGSARWLRIRVTDTATGKAKVNVNLPMGLVDVGLKIGARFAPEIDSEQMDAINTALKSGLSGKIIDVTDEEDGEHVEIFVE
ncbi:MAG: hypothetical protein HYZ49_03175 [Chloroflexi bacterium]|nr:hypothetical protein [Chloroflexota bacterium]